MSNQRVSLNKSEEKLLQYSAGDLIPILAKDKTLLHVKQAAFDYYNPDSNEHYQVHVTVTRDKSNFLEFLQTEEMRAFK